MYCVLQLCYLHEGNPPFLTMSKCMFNLYSVRQTGLKDKETFLVDQLWEMGTL